MVWRHRLHWKMHPRHARLPAYVWPWLMDAASMTAKLRCRCRLFEVVCLQSAMVTGTPEECHALGLPRHSRVLERRVLLYCDGRPVIYGHTVTAAGAVQSHWPYLRQLGNVALGSKLFTDPQVVRGGMTYMRLRPGDRLMQQACTYGAGSMGFPEQLFARRSLFIRAAGKMLVTDVFLPAMDQFMAS